MHAPNWNMPPGWRIKQPSPLTSTDNIRKCLVIQANYYHRKSPGHWEVAFYSYVGTVLFLVDDNDVALWKFKSFKSSPKT